MWERGRGRGDEGWCGLAYKYTYNLTYKYLEFFRKKCGKGEGEGELVEEGTRKGLRFFLGFSWAFAPVANL